MNRTEKLLYDSLFPTHIIIIMTSGMDIAICSIWRASHVLVSLLKGYLFDAGAEEATEQKGDG